MSQQLFIERGHIAGPVDFTKFTYSFDPIEMRKNEPSIFSFSLAKVDSVPGWFVPSRGDYVRFVDTRWEPRYSCIEPGLLFSGYVTGPPIYKFLGKGSDGRQCWGYEVRCSSEDYLINSKRVPTRTFVNKTRGFILKSLLEEMFAGADTFPFDLTNMLDGGTERIFTTDPSKYWTQLAAEFAESDGYVYVVMNRCVLYVPTQSAPRQGDKSEVIVIDETDPRFNPDEVEINQVESAIVNDLTVTGEDEPTTVAFEQFVSDGYQPHHDLTYKAYGIEESDLIVDDFADEIDTQVWEEKDDPAQNYIQPFEGSLNIIGGPGFPASPSTEPGAYLRSRKGIELTGAITFRDGEIFFAPGSTGDGIIGGLYTDTTCKEEDLWCGWAIDLDSNIIGVTAPNGPQYLVGITPLAINQTYHYILRRTIIVDRFTPLAAPIADRLTHVRYDSVLFSANAKITWEVDEINPTNPANVITTRKTLGTMYLPAPEFVLYAAVVPYTCHFVMNFVAVTRPQQAQVEIDKTPTVNGSNVWTVGKESIQVGSFLDGGRCAIVDAGSVSRLAWYATPKTASASADASAEVTTIPPRGTVVSIRYYRNDISKARLQNKASIRSERAKFKDDGIRQLILTKDDVSPSPRTSEECLFIARAALADRLRPRYEGRYKFITKEDDNTNLIYMVLPGDKIQCTLDSPDGELVEVLDVTNVTVNLEGKKTYLIQLEFGPVNRFDAARRELIRRRHSSLQDIVVPEIDVFDANALDVEGFDPVPDPLPPQVNTIGPDYIQVQFGDGSALQTGITGYEVRLSDSGWGKGGEVALFQTFSHNFTRDRRQVAYYFKAYRDDVDGRHYSARSALVRHVYPLKNTIQITGVTTSWVAQSGVTVTGGGKFIFEIPIPSNPDWAQVKVTALSTVIYKGDGLNHTIKAEHVQAFLSNGKIRLEVINITNIAANNSLAAIFLPINVLNEEADVAYQTTFSATRLP
jgi:hypothetical protein